MRRQDSQLPLLLGIVLFFSFFFVSSSAASPTSTTSPTSPSSTTALSLIDSLKLYLYNLNLSRNPFTSRSPIPQFLLDTEHPWLMKHRAQLERLDDVERFLCAMPPLSLNSSSTISSPSSSSPTLTTTSPTITSPLPPLPPSINLSIPPDLFHTLAITNLRSSYRPGYPNALNLLTEIQRCPRALAEAKSLDVGIYVSPGLSRYDSAEDAWASVLEMRDGEDEDGVPKVVVGLMGDVLGGMGGLEKLKWRITDWNRQGREEKGASAWEKGFKEKGIGLNSLKELEIERGDRFFVEMCPELEVLQEIRRSGGYYWREDEWARKEMREFMRAAGSRKRLRELKMEMQWDDQAGEDLVAFIPQLEHLRLLGSIGEESYYAGTDTGDTGKLKSLLTILTRLTNLTHLSLPPSDALSLGFNGGPGCGNVYDGPDGRQYLREITKEAVMATSKGGDVAMEVLPGLEGLVIGGVEARMEKEEGTGRVRAVWPWTGRLEEWVLEEVPDLPEGGWWGYARM